MQESDLHSLIILNRERDKNPRFKDLFDVVFDLRQIVSNLSSTIPTTGLSVSSGGTGATSFNPYSVILSGVTSTSPFSDTGPGTSGQVLTSNGAGSYPSWQSIPAGFITSVSDTATIDMTVAAGSLSAIVVNSSITYSKIQNVTSNRLLGRASIGSGSTEEITLGTGLSYTGTTLNVSGFASSTLTNGHIFVGNASNVATDVAVTGDVTITNTGVTTVGKYIIEKYVSLRI